MPERHPVQTRSSDIGRTAAVTPRRGARSQGVVPGIVVEPADGEAVGALLTWASREKLCVLARGSGTKLGWGPAPRPIDVLISTARLNAVVAHRHGDLTATIQAGATLGGRQSHARASTASGFRSIRHRPIAPRSAASWPPTTADRGGIATARRAI